MSKKVLLIEDDADIQKIYNEKLTGKGFSVTAVSDAASGLTYAKAETPDIILLDIMLPGKMNGFELLEILKRDDTLKSIPVIVMTNLDTEKDEALKVGANAYLIKANISLEDVVNKVREFTS